MAFAEMIFKCVFLALPFFFVLFIFVKMLDVYEFIGRQVH